MVAGKAKGVTKKNPVKPVVRASYTPPKKGGKSKTVVGVKDGKGAGAVRG